MRFLTFGWFGGTFEGAPGLTVPAEGAMSWSNTNSDSNAARDTSFSRPTAGTVRLSRFGTNGQAGSFSLAGPSSTGTLRDVASIAGGFADSTDATRAGKLSLGAYRIGTLWTGITVSSFGGLGDGAGLVTLDETEVVSTSQFPFAVKNTGGNPAVTIYNADASFQNAAWMVHSSSTKSLSGSNTAYIALYQSSTQWLFACHKTGTGTAKEMVFSTDGGSTFPLRMGANANSLGLFGATPVTQPTAAGTTAGFTANAGTAVKDDSTFTGGTGSTAYTIGDIVKALKALGAIAA